MIIFWSDEYFLLNQKKKREIKRNIFFFFKPLSHDSFVGSATHVLVNLCGGKQVGALTCMRIRKHIVYTSLAINESNLCFWDGIFFNLFTTIS